LERGSQKAQVPALVRDLYNPQALYPGEDPALLDQLLLQLADRFQPTDIMQWLLVGELWAVTLDEIRYRRLLAMVLSPGELVQPEPSDAAVAESFEDEVTGICNDRGSYSLSEEEQEQLWDEVAEEVTEQRAAQTALEVTNAPEHARRRNVDNLVERASEIEQLDRLIARCRRAAADITSRVQAMKSLAHASPEIEDAEFVEADNEA
jgi:DNA repair exonuclease SbcCD ATPase subunit